MRMTVNLCSVLQIKGQQQRILMLLKSKKIEFEEVDTCIVEDREAMRKISGNPQQLAPYISNDDEPCGVGTYIFSISSVTNVCACADSDLLY